MTIDEICKAIYRIEGHSPFSGEAKAIIERAINEATIIEREACAKDLEEFAGYIDIREFAYAITHAVRLVRSRTSTP